MNAEADANANAEGPLPTSHRTRLGSVLSSGSTTSGSTTSDADERSSSWPIKVAAGLSLLATAFVTLRFLRLFAYSVDVPFWDQWTFVGFLDDAHRDGLQWKDVWTPHNEHRIVVPRIVLLFLAERTGWNTRAEVGLSFLLLLARFALVMWIVRSIGRRYRSGRHSWIVMPAVAAVCFTSAQVENLIWGWQVTLTLSSFALLLSCISIGRTHFDATPSTTRLLVRFAVGLVCALVAQFSFASGVVLWPLGALFLLAWPVSRRLRGGLVVTWLIAGGVATYFYNQGLPTTPTTRRPGIIELFRYVVTFLGAPFGPNRDPIAEEWGWRFGLVGVTLFLGSIVALAKAGLLRRWSPIVMWGLSAPLTAAVTAIGRLGKIGIPVSQSMSSRYITLSATLWAASFIGLGAAAFEFAHRRRSNTDAQEQPDYLSQPGNMLQPGKAMASAPPAGLRPRPILLAPAIVALALGISLLSALTARGFDKYARERSTELLALRAFLVDPDELTDERKTWMFPDPTMVDRMRPYLIEREFSVFRSKAALDLNK
jgi:hypothetical protein